MRVVLEEMPNAPAPVASVAPLIQVTLIVIRPVDSVVLWVQMVKGMRELRCELFFRDLDVEVAGRWLRQVKDTLHQIQLVEDL
jgi:hypothetical protein